MYVTLQRAYARTIKNDAFWTTLAHLRNMVWPSAQPITMEESGAKAKERCFMDNSELFTVRRDDEVVAFGRLFAREILTIEGPLRVGALASVLTRPDLQGNGYGRLVVQGAFERAGDGTYPVILFQTGVPDFYKRLGAREVSNRFFDSTSATPENNPWQSSSRIMIYPATFAWPDGDIDLCGYGY